MQAEKKRAQRLFSKLNHLFGQVTKAPTPEHVHQLRTNARRIEAILRSDEKLATPKQEKLVKQLGRMRKRAGKVRDIDVQIAALKSVQLDGQYEHKQRLLAALHRKRSKRLRKLGTFLAESQTQVQKRLLKAKAKLFVDKEEKAPPKDHRGEAFQVLSQAADQYLSRARSSVTPDQLHQFRLAVKQMRYAAEMAGNGPRSKAVVTEAKRMQDAIGDWHDWKMLSETASAELQGAASPLVTMLQSMVAVKFSSAVRVASEVTYQLLRDSKLPDKKGPASARLTHADPQRAVNF